MTLTVTPQTIITAAAFVAAAIALILYFTKAVNWFNKQNGQSDEIKNLDTKHDDDIKRLEGMIESNMRAMQKELSIITKGQLACLQGLHEKGCNGPVTKAIGDLENFLNGAAHDQ